MAPLLLGLLGLWIGVRTEVEIYEHAMADDLAARLDGPEKRVNFRSDLGPEAVFGDVHQVTLTASDFIAPGLPLFTEPNHSRRGLIRDLEIHLEDFTLKGLRVLSLDASIQNCRFDLSYAIGHKKLRLTQSGVGSGQVSVSQDSLRNFVLKKFPNIKRAELTIANDKISIDGRGQFGMAILDFYLIGRLEPVHGSQLNLADAHLLLNGQAINSEATKLFVGRLNPVVDENRDLELQDALNIRSVQLKKGVLTASGEAMIPSRSTRDPSGRTPRSR